MIINKYRSRNNLREWPWYEYLFVLVGLPLGFLIIDWMSGRSFLLIVTVALSVGGTAGYIAYVFGRWLSRRVPALKSKHVGYFDW